MSSGYPTRRPRDCFAAVDDDFVSLWMNRNLGTATDLVRALGVEVSGIPQSQASIEAVSS